MSYWCKISFKTLPASELFGFFQEFKAKAIERMPEIANENAAFSPMMRAYHFNDDFEISKELLDKTEEWATNSIFRYRWFYLEQHNLLGIYSLPNCMQDLFDDSLEFQNSCDQDYELDYWEKIPYFKSFADKWVAASDDTILDRMRSADYYREEPNIKRERIEYFRRSICYKEIWDAIGWTLENDQQIVYLSLFGLYDLPVLQEFVVHVKSAVLARSEEWNKERGDKK